MRQIISTIILCLLLSACTTQSLSQPYAGRVLLWHSLADEAEQATLDRVLNRFIDIYEDVEVVSNFVSRDDMLERYQTAAAAGLGPNLVLGQSEWVLTLVENDLIADLSPFDPRTDIYYTGAITNLRYQDGLYGLPLAMRPVALYYNTNLVETPASTLDELLQEAASGNRVAINTRFDRAFWGTQAFGGSLFDSEGRTILNEGGFANWLRWLRSAQDAPGVFLARDAETLVDLFTRQRVAYMVATPDVLPAARAALGEETVGVIPLPSGPGGTSGPLLHVDALMLNPASSANQAGLSMLLARFLTSSEQGGVFVTLPSQ